MPDKGNFPSDAQQGMGKGRMGGKFAAGPGGRCICPSCYKAVAHTRGEPCNQRRCPECGAIMARE
ncbi:MAG: hypothetical protein RBU23_13120 [Candidatus Auribacterota bacterium]|jgi:hypothetical protein|nr:hypothetical protein [Candidatus Auribacterota bacterium]